MQQESFSVDANGHEDILQAPTADGAQAHDEEKHEFEWLLSHAELARSPNLVRFLTYICDRYFEGEAGEIREYSIAVNALGRKASSFDARVDPIVRVTARTLRKKLSEIYRSDGAGRTLQLTLPLGGYVPQFLHVTQEQVRVHEPSETSDVSPGVDQHPADRTMTKWIQSHRSMVLRACIILVCVVGVFCAGYFQGRRHERVAVLPNSALNWGEPVWSDEFSGSAQQLPDAAKWTYDKGSNGGWGNRELEIYCSPREGGNPKECDVRHPNVFEDGAGHLVVRAQKSADGRWTSARITTLGVKSFQYGRIEARMKLPVGSGLWPAFWMLGSNYRTVGWPDSGSVTIAENAPSNAASNGLGPQMIRSTLHGPRYSGANGLWHDFTLSNGERVDDGNFHAYGIIWSPGMIQFYVDDPANIYFVQDSSNVPAEGAWIFDRPFSLNLNLAVGGAWPGNPDISTPNPADMLVDYVRVYTIPKVEAPGIQLQSSQIRTGSSLASAVILHSTGFSGRVHLTCATESPDVSCVLATSVVDFSNTLQQEDTLTISTVSFSDRGRLVAAPGKYKVTITATTISGDRSQLSVPFDVVAGS